MFDTLSVTTDSPEQARKRYERLVYLLIGIGCIGLVAGLVLEQQLAGTVIYLAGVWVGIGIAVALPYWSDIRFYDERDEEIAARASGLTMYALFIVGISVVPALYVLSAAAYIQITATMWGAIYLASALYLFWGLCYLLVTRRY